MIVQYVNNLKNLEYKQTDIIFCHLTDEKIDADSIFENSLISYLLNLSTQLNCLIFAYFTLSYSNNLNQPQNNAFNLINSTQHSTAFNKSPLENKIITHLTQTLKLPINDPNNQNSLPSTNGAVAIISNGTLIDIYEENDINTRFNLSTYKTRLGKISILINNDIYNQNIFYALNSLNVDLVIIFIPSAPPFDVFSQIQNLPLIFATSNNLFVYN